MTNRTRTELADALEEWAKSRRDNQQGYVVSEKRTQLIESSVTALRELEGERRIEGWVAMEVIEDVEDPDSQHTYYVTTKQHCDGDDRCTLIIQAPEEKDDEPDQS